MVAPALKDRVHLSFAIEEPPGGWLLEEEDVPETPLHVAVVELLLLVFRQWIRTEGRDALVTANLGCRWDPSDARVGTDPDLVLVEPAPPEGEELSTLRIWEPNHASPRIAVEVVSDRQPEKDYVEAPARCRRLGVSELWIFDPLLRGPETIGGPFLLQIWRPEGTRPNAPMTRIYAGPGPAQSPELGAWLLPTSEGRRLRLAQDRAGEHLWLTEAETQAARADNEAARADHEAARADNEAARAKEALAQLETAEAEMQRLRALLDER